MIINIFHVINNEYNFIDLTLSYYHIFSSFNPCKHGYFGYVYVLVPVKKGYGYVYGFETRKRTRILTKKNVPMSGPFNETWWDRV